MGAGHVQTHDELGVIQALPNELPAIGIPGL